MTYNEDRERFHHWPHICGECGCETVDAEFDAARPWVSRRCTNPDCVTNRPAEPEAA